MAKYLQSGKVFQLICKALVAKFSVVCTRIATEQTIYKDGNMCFANLVNNERLQQITSTWRNPYIINDKLLPNLALLQVNNRRSEMYWISSHRPF